MKDVRTVQYLRAVAAISVVLYHAQLALERFGYPVWRPDFLKSGVDIFFVISGFVMWISTCDQNVSPQHFMKNRLIRIAPLYWVVTSFTVCVMLLSPSSMQSGVFNLPHVIRSYLFIPALNAGTGDMDPVIPPGWTLNYEMFFYCIFAIALILPVRYRVAALMAALVGLSALRPWFPGHATIGHFYTSTLMLEFGLGVLIGVCFMSDRTDKLLSAKACVLIIAGGAVLSALHPISGIVGWGTPAAMIVLGCVMLERRVSIPRWRLPCMLGDCSYSLYLTHGIVLSALGQAWRMARLTDIPGGIPLFVPTAVIVSCGVAVAAYKLVECPMTRSLRVWNARPSTPPPAMAHSEPALTAG
jgi:peptidoglycan/LPS O-acetylase OafA/YrhL